MQNHPFVAIGGPDKFVPHLLLKKRALKVTKKVQIFQKYIENLIF